MCLQRCSRDPQQHRAISGVRPAEQSFDKCTAAHSWHEIDVGDDSTGGPADQKVHLGLEPSSRPDLGTLQNVAAAA